MVKSLIIAMASSSSFRLRLPTGVFSRPNRTTCLRQKLFRRTARQPGHLGDNFDLWLINTGYQYPLQDDIGLMEAGPTIGPKVGRPANISSGVRYRLPSFNIGSQLKQLEVSKASTLLEPQQQPAVNAPSRWTANYGLSAFSTEHFHPGRGLQLWRFRGARRRSPAHR